MPHDSMEVFVNPQALAVRPEEAAKLTGLSISRLAKLRLYGEGPSYLKIGRSILYEPKALEAWLSERSRRSTSDAGEK
jgi:predicted DNA-binding transcriptional regulator AlpA